MRAVPHWSTTSTRRRDGVLDGRLDIATLDQVTGVLQQVGPVVREASLSPIGCPRLAVSASTPRCLEPARQVWGVAYNRWTRRSAFWRGRELTVAAKGGCTVKSPIVANRPCMAIRATRPKFVRTSPR